MESSTAVDAAGAEQQQQPQHEIADQAQHPDASPASQPDAAADAEARKASGVTDRINKLVGQRLAAQREAAELRERLAAYEAGRQSAAPAQPAADEGPKEGDFSDYGQFLEARAVWRAEKAAEARFQKLQESQAAARQEAQTREQQQSQIHEFVTQMELLAEDVPDLRQAVQTGMQMIPVQSALGQALLSSDKGAALTYYLASNPAELTRLESIQNPVRAAIEIARLESKADAHLQSRTRSRAARQAAPLGGSTGSGRGDQITGNESMEEFARKWDARRRR